MIFGSKENGVKRLLLVGMEKSTILTFTNLSNI